ncbi:hypothetical protein EXS61_01340 [Candidatus Parcubacteria bacterium]|nr:hypothetical protein [Candidatus Parcubacteria bacterium]
MQKDLKINFDLDYTKATSSANVPVDGFGIGLKELHGFAWHPKDFSNIYQYISNKMIEDATNTSEKNTGYKNDSVVCLIGDGLFCADINQDVPSQVRILPVDNILSMDSQEQSFIVRFYSDYGQKNIKVVLAKDARISYVPTTKERVVMSEESGTFKNFVDAVNDMKTVRENGLVLLTGKFDRNVFNLTKLYWIH